MKNLEEQIKQWNDENEFEKCVEAIKAVPEAERGYELTLLLGRAYSNIAVLGPHCERPDGDADMVDVELLDKAISIFESIRAGGENDPFWNSRMAYALWMADGREAEALTYAERWLELEPESKDAKKLIGSIREFLDDDDEEGGENFTLETYDDADWDTVQEHIAKYFGDYDNVMHEIASEGIHLDVCVIPPREEHNYYTLVTLGMGAHKMNVPEELADQKLERAELLINLPPDWNLTQEAMRDDKWFWPIRILKSTARYPLRERDTWLGWGHTLGDDDGVPFSDGTKLCGALLLSPGVFGEDSYVCKLADGDEVNFYQLIPLYKEEIDFKREHGVDELLEKCSDETLEVIDPQRLNVITDADKIDYDDALMESAEEHIKVIEEKKLPVGELAAYNHLAIYLRWSIEHDFMSNPFLRSHGETIEAVKKGGLTDLREFMRGDDDINGKLSLTYFNHEGTEFAKWYSWGSRATPYAYLKDVKAHAVAYFGEERAKSEEFGGSAYLFVPWSEDYYRAMAEIIDHRYAQWKALDKNQRPEKNFAIKAEDIKPLLKDWDGAAECCASDRILVDGCKIGYCERFRPSRCDEGWKSGWLFLAGDEDEEYLDDEDNFSICDLNTICNYDPEIMPFLTRPYGESLDFRDLDGGGEEDDE